MRDLAKSVHCGCVVGPRAALALAAVFALLGGCHSEPSTAPTGPVTPVCTVRGVSVSPSTVTMATGQSLALSATVDAANCAQTTPAWTSTDDRVARVSSAGMVTAITPGTVSIVANVGGLTGSARVSVGPEPIIINAPVASIVVAPQSVPLQVGQAAQLTATLRDAAGSMLSGRVVVWSSSDRSVADVSTGGYVVAMGGGTAVITATSEGRAASALVTVSSPTRTSTLTIVNQLIYPIDVDAGGSPLGSVAAEGTRSFALTSANAVRINWSLRRPTVNGREIGDVMSGFWELQNPGATVQLTVDNVVGTTWYFAPLVTNTSGTTLLMAVNWGLTSENRCNCTVPANGLMTHLGYYRLFTNSNVTAFRSGTTYTGPYRYFFDFGASVPRGSGRAFFTFNLAP